MSVQWRWETGIGKTTTSPRHSLIWHGYIIAARISRIIRWHSHIYHEPLSSIPTAGLIVTIAWVGCTSRPAMTLKMQRNVSGKLWNTLVMFGLPESDKTITWRGSIHNTKIDLKAALKHANNALQIAQEQNDSRNICQGHFLLGIIHHQSKDLSLAKAHYTKGYAKYESNKQWSTWLTFELGAFHAFQKNFTKARDCLDESRSMQPWDYGMTVQMSQLIEISRGRGSSVEL